MRYRYTILLDRDGEEDYGPVADDDGTHHDGSADAAIRQVARELQEAMDETGLPFGSFDIVKREAMA